MVKGSKKSKKSPIFDMEPIFIECPHIHFKADTIDRGILSRQQHMNLLSTPKGYRWDVKKEGGDLEAKSDGSFQGLGSKYGPRVICGRRIRKPEKEYIHNFLAEIWALLTPEMIDRLKEMLMLEFGMSPTEAEMFVLEQKGKNIKPGIVFKGCGVNGCTCTARPKVASIRRKEDSFQPGSKLTLNHACIKDFSNAMASKLMDYFVLQLSTKRDKKVKTLAERILKQLCEITGESCTLNNPKTRMHRILVFAADRLACWFAQNLELKKKTVCTCDANNDNIDAEIVKGFQKFKVPDFRIFDTGDCTCDQSKFCHCVQVSKRQDKHSQTLDKKASEYDLKASSKEIMKTIDGSKYTFREKQTQTQTERTIDNIQETYSVDHLETKPVMEAATVENYTHDYDGSMKDTKETTQVVTKGKPQRTSKFTAEPTLPLIKEEDEVEVKDEGKKTEVVEETSKEVEETQIEETLVESVEVSKVDHSRGRSKSVINPESSKRDVSIKRETSKSPGKDYNVDDEKVKKSKSVKDAGSKSKVTNEKEHSKSPQKGPSKIDISKVKSKSAVDALSKIDSEEKVERSESVKNAGSKVDASEAKERSKSPDKGTRGSRMDTFREKSKSAVDVESKLDISGKKVENSKSAISEAKDKERSKSPEKQTAGSSKLDISRDKSKSAVDAGSNDDEVEKSKLFQANKRSNFPVKEKTGSMGDLLREKSKSKVNVEKSKSGKLDERGNEKERSNSVKRTGSSMIEIGVEKLKSAIFGQTDKKSKSVDVFTEKAKERSTSPLQKSEEVNKKSQKDAYTNSNKHLVIKENVYDEKLSNERSSKNGISGENTDTMKEEVNVSDEKVKLSKSMKGLPGSKSDLEEFAVEESRNDENVKLEKYEVTEVPSGIEVAETTNKSKPRGQSPIKSFLQESLKSFKEMSPIKSIREMSPMKSIREMSPIKSIKEMSPIKSIKEMSPIKTLKNMSPIKSLRGMSPIKSLRELSPLKSLKSLREMSPIKSLKIPKDDAETEEQPLEEIFVGHKSRESQKATQGGLPIRPSSKNIDGDLKEPTDKKIDDGVLVPGIETEPLSKNPVGPSVSSIKKDPSFKKLDGVTLPDLGSEPSGKKLDRVTVSDIETEPSSKKPDGTSVSNIKIEPSSKILDGVSVSDKETEPSSKKHDGTSVTNTKRDPSSKILDGVIVSEKETEPSSKNPDGTSVSSIKKDPSSKKLDGVAVDDINIASSGKKIDGISVSDIEKDSSSRKIDEVVILESQKEISTKDFEEISVPVVFDGRVPGGEHDVQLKVEKNPENGRYEVTLKGDIEKVRVINDSPRSKRILVLLESVLNGEQLSGEPSKRETFSLKDKSSTKFTVPRMEETPSHPGSGKFHAEEVRRVAKKGQNVPSADDWTQTSIDFNELSDVLYVRDVGCQTDYVELSDDSVTDSSSVLRVVGSESTTARIFFLEGTSHMPKKKDKSKSASRVVSKVEVYEEKVEDRVEKTSFQLEKSIFARGSEVNVSGETARASKVDISSGKEKLEPGSSSKKKLHLNENELWYLEDEAKRDKTTEETEKVIIVSPKEISDLKRSGSQEIAKTRDSKEDGGTQANPLTKQPLKEGADKALNKISAEEALYDEIVTGIFFVSSPTDRIIKPSETRGTDSGEPSDGQAAAISKNVFFSDSHEERQETLQPGKESPKKEKAQTSNKRSAESTRSDQLKIKTNEINLLPGDILPAKLRSAEGNTQTNRINMKLPELVVSQKEILPTKTTSVEDSTQTDRIKVKLPALQVSAEEILQTKTKSENNSTQIDGMQVMLPKLVVSKEVEPNKTISAEDSTQTDRIKVKLPESVVSQKEILPTKRKSAKDSTKTEGIKVSAEEILPTKTKSAEDSTQTDGIQVMLPELVVSKEAVPKKTKSVEDSTQTDRIKVKLPELQVSAEEILKTKTKSENNSTQIDGMQVMLPKLVVSKEVEPNKTKSAEDSTQTDRIKVKLPESVVSQKEILPTKRKSAKDSIQTEGIKVKLPELQVSAEEILPTKTKSAEDSTQTDGIQVMLPELVVSKEAVPKKTKSVEDNTQTDRIKVKLPELRVSAEEILPTKAKSAEGKTQTDRIQVMLPNHQVLNKVVPTKTKSDEYSTQNNLKKVKLPELEVSAEEILPTETKSAEDSTQTDRMKVKLPELEFSAKEILPTKTKSAEDSTQTDRMKVKLPELEVSAEEILPTKTKSAEDSTQTDRMKVKLPELEVSAEEILPTKTKSAEDSTQTDRMKVKLPELEVSAEEILPTKTKSAEDSTQTDRMKVKLPELEVSAEEILPTKTKSAEDSTQTDRIKVKLPELEVSAEEILPVPEEEILPTKSKNSFDRTQTHGVKAKFPGLVVSAEEIVPAKTKSVEGSTQTERREINLSPLMVSNEDSTHPFKSTSVEDSTQTDREIVRHPKLVEPLGAEINPKSNSLIFEQSSQTDRIVSKLNSEISLLDENTQTNLDNMVPSSQNISELDLKPNDLQTTLSTRSTQTRKKILSKQTSYELVREELVSLPDFIDEWTQTKKTISHKTIITSEINVEEEFDLKKEEKDMLPEMKEESSEAKESTAEAKVPPEPVIKSEMPEEPTAVSDVNILTEEAIPLEVKPKVFKPKVVLPREIQDDILTITSKSEETVEKLEKPHVDEDAVKIEESADVKISSAHSTEASKIREEVEAPEVIRGSPTVVVPPELPEEPVEPHSDLPKTLLPVTMQEEPKIEEPTAETKIESSPIWSKPIQLPVSPAGKASLSPIFETIPTKEELNNALTLLDYPSEPVQIDQTEREFSKMPSASPIKDPFKDETEILVQPDIPNDSEKLIPPDKDLVKMPEPKRDIKLEEPEVLPVIEIPTSELEKPEERSGKEEPFPSVMLPIQEKSKFEQPDDVKLTASKPTESINAVPMTSEVKKSETNEAISLLEIPLPPETREPTKSIPSFSQEVQKTPSAESAFPPVEQKMEVPELLEKSEVTLASDISVRAISKETAKSPLVEVVQEEQKSELITQEVQVEPVIKTPKPEPEEIPVYVKIIPSVPEILTREKPGEIPVEKARSSIPQKAKSFEKLNDIDSFSDEKERVSCSEIEAIAIEECTEDAIERHLLDSCIKLLNWFQGMSLFRVKSVGKLDEECESPSKLLEVDRQCSEEILTKLYSSLPLMTDKEITDTRKSTNDAVKKPSPEIRKIQGATEKVMLASLKEPSLEKTAPQVTDPEKIPEISQELAADEEPPTEKVEPKISDFMERILSEVEEPPLLEISTPEDTEPIRNPNVPQNITAATEKPSIIGKRVAKISEFNRPILAEVNELEGIEPAKIHIEIPKEIATIAKEASTEKLEVKISEVREPTEMPTEVEEPSLKKVLPESIEPIEIPEEPQGIGAAAKESSIEKVVSEIIDFIKPNGIPPLEALPETNESVEPNDLADAEEPPFGEVALEITQVEEEITTGVKKLKKMSDIEIKKEPFQEIDSSRIKEEVPDVLLDKIEPLKEILEAREVNVPSLEMILPEHECRSETQVNEMVTDIINDVLEHVLAQVVKAPSKDEVQVADLHKFPSTTSLEIHIPKRIRTKSSVCKDPSQKNISRAGSKDNAKQTSNSEWVLHKVKEHPLPEDPSIHDIPYDMRESSHVPNFLPTKTTEIEDLKKEDSHDTSIKKEESTERLQEAVRIRSKTSRGPSQESLTKDEANCSSEGVSKIPSKKTVSIISGERYKRDEVPSLKTIFPEKEISEPEAVPSLDVKEVAKSAISLPRISLKERIKVKDSQPPVVDIKTPQKVDQQLKKSPPVSVTEDLPNKDEILPKKQDTSSVFSAISADVSPTVDSFAFKIEESSEGEISEELELLPWPDPTKDIPTKSISVPPPESRMNTIFKGSTNRPSFPRFQPKLRVEHEVFDQFGKGETELYKKIAEWFDNVEVDVTKSDRQIAIGEIIEKKLSGSQHGDGQDVGLSEKIAAWVDREVDKIEKDEIPRSVCKCLKREGPTFHVRRDGYAYDITPISDEIVKTKVAENRSLYSDKTDAMVGPLLKSEFKAWARWACDAVQVAEQWANWIDDTCMKAQLKVLDRKEGPKKCRCIEYEQWQKKVEDDALEWQRNKHLLKKVADFWLLKAQQP